jgi:PAS domain-containing protein
VEISFSDMQIDGQPRLRRLHARHDAAHAQQQALQRSEERYRRIVQTAEEGIWMIDAATVTTFVNPKMASMLGYTAEEMLGRSCTTSWTNAPARTRARTCAGASRASPSSTTSA